MLGSPSAAFLTHIDSSDDSAEPRLEEDNEFEELLAEKEQLQDQSAAILQKLAALKAKPSQRSAFVPLASIFPLRRDAFSHGKSAEQQLRIYRKEHKRVFKRFHRASDTNYAYSLEHSLVAKSSQIRELEQNKIALQTSNKALERELLRVKSEAAANEEAATMTDQLAHVVLLRDQVDGLERAAEAREALARTSAEALTRAESRYHRIKEIACDLGVSLKTAPPDTLKAEYNTLLKRLGMIEKTACSKELLKVKELMQEKRRLEETAEQLQTLFMDQTMNLDQARSQLSQIRNVQTRTLRGSMSTSHILRETSSLERLPQAE